MKAMKSRVAAKMLAEYSALGLHRPAIIEPSWMARLGDIEEMREVCSILSIEWTQSELLTLGFLVPVESPIEAIFHLAAKAYFLAAAQADGSRLLRHRCPERHHAPEDGGWNGEAFGLGMCHQHQLGKYRIDVLLTPYIGQKPLAPVAVELDGHDFHERTKEQARHDRRKDRFIQSTNLKILRFTGSEIHAGPIACAREAINAAFGRDIGEWLRR